jgi:sortase A
MKRTRKYVQIGLLICGCAILARPAGRWVKRTAFHWRAVEQWEQRDPSASGPEAAWLTIDSAGIDTLILAGETEEQLNLAPCLESFPNNTLIMAHRDTHFRGLKDTTRGDVILLERRDGTQQTYKISDTIIIDASQAEKIIHETRNKNCLILLTCYPFTTIGPAPSRILFIADPV